VQPDAIRIFRQARLLLEGLLEGHLGVFRDELGDQVRLLVGDVQRSGYVLDDGLGLQGPEGDDAADPVLPVFLRDVVDDLPPPFEAEVHVEVRHGHALGIQEALEQQHVLDGVEVGDAQRPGYQRPGARAAARPDGPAVLARPADEVGHDQEVAGEAHLADHVQLAL
jgi:hypothetical protein